MKAPLSSLTPLAHACHTCVFTQTPTQACPPEPQEVARGARAGTRAAPLGLAPKAIGKEIAVEMVLFFRGLLVCMDPSILLQALCFSICWDIVMTFREKTDTSAQAADVVSRSGGSHMMLYPSVRTLAVPGIGPQRRSSGASAQSTTATATAAMTIGTKRRRVHRLTPKQLQDAKAKQSSDSRLYNLVLDVNNLKQHVRDLMVQNSLLATQRFLTTLDGTGSALKTVSEFFVVCSDFEPGSRKLLAFIQTVTDPGFAVGTTSFGVEMVFAQFVRYNEAFNSHGFTLGTTTVLVSDHESCIVQTLCTFHGRISRNTLVKLFPAALADESLVAKLIGRELHFPVKILLYFRDRLMTRMDVDSDILAGFSELLDHNPFELAALMSNAAIQGESMIGDLERIEELVDDLTLDSAAASPDEESELRGEAGATVADNSPQAQSPSPSNRHSLSYLLS